MKTKYWILLLAAVFAVCAVLGFALLSPGSSSRYARIYSQGVLLKVVDLMLEQEFTVATAQGGRNVITVTDGKIAVTQANCPDHYCMDRGFCSGGAHIVCLPNQLVIQFQGASEVDTVVE